MPDAGLWSEYVLFLEPSDTTIAPFLNYPSVLSM